MGEVANRMTGRSPAEAVLVTSIVPSADGRLASVMPAALRSFAANGFSPLSVNRPDEVKRVRDLFPQLAVVAASSGRAAIFRNRYGPALGSVFDASAAHDWIGICNADVVMLAGDIRALLERRPDTFFAAHRLDIDRIGGDILGLYRRGVDAVFFNRTHYAALLDDPDLAKFQLGAPLWDIVMPVLASFHGPVALIRPPFILHVAHKARWAAADYRLLRRLAVETVVRHAERYAGTRPEARRFLDLFDRVAGRRTATTGRRGDLRKAMAAINLWRTKLERDGTVDVHVDLAGEIGPEALKKLARPLADTPTDPDEALAGGLSGQLGARRLRQLVAARLRVWKSRRRERELDAQLADLGF
jgi:hypothetical protein